MAGVALGTLEVPICPDLRGGILAPFLLGSNVIDAEGETTFDFFVPQTLSGFLFHFQAIDVDNCQVSSIRSLFFP